MKRRTNKAAVGTGNPPRPATVKGNRLMQEKSPYLLQHAHNPVDWYPWSEEAFEKARREDKPVFLSIGYSTCHWCHVMEKESFEDEEAAKLLNEVFVCIKVDREERPDIDAVYMGVSLAMTGSGGWPLTIFMTAEKKPFFAGTYIPKESGYGRVGLVTLVNAIQEVWRNRRAEVQESAESIAKAVRQAARGEAGEAPDETILKRAYGDLARNFDEVHGGFGSAPKFPRAHGLMFLLRHWRRSGQTKALAMVEKTLQEMRRGGMWDHVGFGFHRYSTDARWLVPHFEKMLYDQAMLAMAYTEAYQATGKAEYEQSAREIVEYVLRDMTSPEGGFHSAQDADSEGEEGKFYVWSAEEILKVLGNEKAKRFMRVFGMEEVGNWSGEESGRKSGTNILHLEKPMAEAAGESGLSEGELRTQMEEGRKKLFAARAKRVRPHRDDKILTDWNGLMIAALAKAGRTFDDSEYVAAAERAVGFVLGRMRTAEGRLLHRYRDGESAVAGLVEDYAFLVWGLLELYEADFKVEHLETAIALNGEMLKHFWDGKSGGFFQTADDAEELLVRRKEVYDGAAPSGNSVAATNLLRLGRMTADPDLEAKARKTVEAFARQVREAPAECAQFLQAVDFLLGPAYEIVIVGKWEAADTQAMLRALRSRFLPNKVVLLQGGGPAGVSRVAPFTAGQKSIDEQATVYVCRDFICKGPTTSVEEMLSELGVKS